MLRLVHLTPGRSGRQGEVGQAGEAVRRLVWRRAGARDRAGGCRWTLPDKREYIWLCADEEEWVQLPCETRCRRTFVGEKVAERKTWQGVWQSIWHVAWQVVWQSNWQGVRQGAHLEQEKGADGGEEEQEVPGEILSLLTISFRNPQFYTNNLSQKSSVFEQSLSEILSLILIISLRAKAAACRGKARVEGVLAKAAGGEGRTPLFSLMRFIFERYWWRQVEKEKKELKGSYPKICTSYVAAALVYGLIDKPEH